MIAVSIPYPNAMDTLVGLKKEYAQCIRASDPGDPRRAHAWARGRRYQNVRCGTAEGRAAGVINGDSWYK